MVWNNLSAQSAGQRKGADPIHPVFWEIGQTRDGKAVLTNPQAQNSYSYAENNPLIKKDPEGRLGFIPAVLYGIQTYGAYTAGFSIGEVLNANLLFRNSYSTIERNRANFDFGFNTLTTVASFGLNKWQDAFLTLAPDILDGIDKIRASTYYNSQNPNSKQYVNPSSNQPSIQQITTQQSSQQATMMNVQTSYSALRNAGFTNTQSSAVMNVANSFGATTLSAQQMSSIQSVKRAFTK
jgi:hypothetical protein